MKNLKNIYGKNINYTNLPVTTQVLRIKKEFFDAEKYTRVGEDEECIHVIQKVKNEKDK